MKCDDNEKKLRVKCNQDNIYHKQMAERKLLTWYKIWLNKTQEIQ